jgi:hypothetical protein
MEKHIYKNVLFGIHPESEGVLSNPLRKVKIKENKF